MDSNTEDDDNLLDHFITYRDYLKERGLGKLRGICRCLREGDNEASMYHTNYSEYKKEVGIEYETEEEGTDSE